MGREYTAGRRARRAGRGWGVLWALAFAVVLTVPAQARQGAGVAAVELRRTTDGIPHVRATTWRGLGLGAGYAQAQDALCTLADAFVTYEGRRSRFFGAKVRPAQDSTLGRPTNLELDLFF